LTNEFIRFAAKRPGGFKPAAPLSSKPMLQIHGGDPSSNRPEENRMTTSFPEDPATLFPLEKGYDWQQGKGLYCAPQLGPCYVSIWRLNQ